MGKAFGNLTRPGVETGDGGAPQFFDTQAEQVQAFADASRKALQPSAATENGGFVDQSAPMPKMVKPKFSEVAGDGQQINPAETKAGKLVHLLTAGLKGGLAGRRASEQAVIASGGHRSAGFATGADAAIMEPVRQKKIALDLEDQQLQNQQRRVMIPWLMKKQQADMDETNATIALRQAQTEAARALAGQRELSDEEKINVKATIAAKYGLKEGSPEWKSFVLGLTPERGDMSVSLFEAWQKQNPNGKIEQWLDLTERTKARYDKTGSGGDKQREVTPYQSSQIEDEYQQDLKKARDEYDDPKYAKPTILDKKLNEEIDNPNYIPDEQRAEKLKRDQEFAEQKYFKKIRAAGGSAPGSSTGWQRRGEKQETKSTETKAAPKSGEVKYYQGKPYKFDGKQWVLSASSS